MKELDLERMKKQFSACLVYDRSFPFDDAMQLIRELEYLRDYFKVAEQFGETYGFQIIMNRSDDDGALPF